MSIYKFSSTAVQMKPVTPTTILLENAMSGSQLTREEKDKVAEILYGIMGSGVVYKLAGWAWNMEECFPRILVKHKCDKYFTPYYAPDKTSLRKALKQQIDEMIVA